MTFLPRHEFNRYLNILLLSSEARQKTNTLQDLFFMSLRGVRLFSEYWEDLMPILVQSAKSEHVDLRRWSFKLASLCRNAEINRDLIKHCENNLDLLKDNDVLNRTWMVSILSQHFEPKKFYSIIGNANHGLTSENIDLAKYLFQRDSKVDMKKVWIRLDPVSLMWVAQLGAYNTIASINKVQPFVTRNDLTKILAETDDDDALRASMYSFYLQNTFTIDDLPFKPSNYKKMGRQTMKWFLSTIWKDEKFILSNADFAEEIIFDAREFLNKNNYLGLSSESSKEVRVGIARGISNSSYVREITQDIADWFVAENSDAVKQYLFGYIYSHQDRASAFKEIVELQKYDDYDAENELVHLHIFNTKESEMIRQSKGKAHILQDSDNSSNNKPSIFISYNWGDSAFVDILESSLNEVADIRRDKTSLCTWSSITDFMKTIRTQDFAVLVISDAYLKSIPCLFEVVQLMKDDIWPTKTMYIVMEDATGLYKPATRVDYVRYWTQECEQLENSISELPRSAITNLTEDLRKSHTILLSIDEFMAKASDANNPNVRNAIMEIKKRIGVI